MYYYASHNYRHFANAGNISKNFIEHIMQDMGFRNAAIAQTHFKSKVVGFFATLTGVAAIPFRLHKGDFLVLQYPVKKYYTLICRMAHFRGGKSHNPCARPGLLPTHENLSRRRNAPTKPLRLPHNPQPKHEAMD